MRWNTTFKAFADFWGFEPRLCRAYRAQTKGKVESGVKYFTRNFLAGRRARLLWLRFYRRQTMAVLTEGLERAFARFGGVPKELLFDQMRAVGLSDQRVGGGELVLNAEFLRVAAHWGFHPRACRPYRAQTKGKVERPIRYIRDSFFYGRAFANDEDLNEQASRWLEGTANVRRHGTTGERPVDRFERDEREALGPLARRPYQRLGVHRGAQPVHRRVPDTIAVERRSLRVYAEAAG